MNSEEVCLQIDVGNSSAKWRCCQGEKILARGTYRADDANSKKTLLACSEDISRIWVSSVASSTAEEALAGMLKKRWKVQPWFARTASETAGLTNSYADPSRMGVDRWLAMLGARARFDGSLLVVDAGSALTIDSVDATGQHLGGYIIPGPALMERALLLDTDRVRFSEDVDYALSPGTSTAEAVRHGIALAQAGSVSLALAQSRGDAMTLVFSGGAGETLMRLLGGVGHWEPDLVFEGLQVMGALDS